MNPDDLKDIDYVNIDEVWDHEERDFSPWLVNHIERLEQTLGIEIEDARLEDSVGGYKADITGTERNTGGKVVIENQFGTTNHDHLGKLLTYAAGKEAEFVIWIAEDFRDEHRSVLEWLNGGAPGAAKFFGIRPRVVKLDSGDEGGFEFSVAIEPNDWERELQDESLTVRKEAYLEFYSQLSQAYAENNPGWNRLKAQPQSWLSFGAGKAGLGFAWSFHRGPEFAVELYIDVGEKEENEELFRLLKSDQQEIEDELGPVAWQELPDSNACRIKVKKDISANIEDLSEDESEELIEWGVKNMDAFREQFEPRIE